MSTLDKVQVQRWREAEECRFIESYKAQLLDGRVLDPVSEGGLRRGFGAGFEAALVVAQQAQSILNAELARALQTLAEVRALVATIEAASKGATR